MDRRRALMMAKKGPGKSDMKGWTDGVTYTDLEIQANKYINHGGGIESYSGWSAIAFVPCDGASTLTFPPVIGASSLDWNCFWDASKNFISVFSLSKTEQKTVAVPANAAFWGISAQTTAINACVNAGIVPHA